MAWGETMYALDEIRSMLNLNDRVDLLENNEPKLIVASTIEPELQPKGGLWININEEGFCNGFKVKVSDTEYSDFKKIGLLSDYVFCDNGLSVKEVVNNLGNKIYIAKGTESMNVRIITNGNFKPVLGSKILVRFEAGLNSDTGLYFKIDDENGDQIIYKEVLSSSREMDVNGVNWVKVPIDKNSVNPNNLYEFLYTADGFLWMNGGSVIATNESLGMVKGGGDGDITVNNNGEMVLTSHKSVTGSINDLGHVRVTEELDTFDGSIPNLVPTAQSVKNGIEYLRDVIDNSPFLSNKNYITNGDFLVNGLHSEDLVCDAWIKSENPENIIYDEESNSIEINGVGSIEQYINEPYKISEDMYIINISYVGYGLLSVIVDGEEFKNYTLNGLNSDFGMKEEFDLNLTGINKDSIMKIKLESLEIDPSLIETEEGEEPIEKTSGLVINYVDMKVMPISGNYSYNHIEGNYDEELERCRKYSNTTGEILNENELGVNENLLINPSFKICREKIEYPVNGWGKVVADGWITSSPDGIEFSVIEKKGIKIKPTIKNKRGSITQFITNAKDYIGKYMTFSCSSIKAEDDDGISKFRLAYYIKKEDLSDIEYKEIITTNGYICTTVKIPEETGEIEIVIGVPPVDEDSECYSIIIYNPKVEISKTATSFKENSYAKDLSLCLNYDLNSDCSKTSELKKSKNGVGENLLINSNFKVNQRNFNHYYTVFGDVNESAWYRCTSNSYQFGVDRWIMGMGTTEKINKNADGTIDTISISYYEEKNKDAGNFFSQYIECPKEAKGKEITFSTFVTEATEGCKIYIGTITSAGDWCGGGDIDLKANEICSYTTTCANNVDIIYVGFRFPEKTISTIKPLWTKLEIGDEPTEYVSPNYETELIKCKRYFQVIKYNKLQYFNLTQKWTSEKIQLPVEMRIAPTLTVDSLKYDSYPMGNDISCVPSSSYYCNNIDKDCFNFNYRNMSGSAQIGTTTLKRKDIGIMRDVGNDKTYFSNADTRNGADSIFLQVCGGSSLNGMYPREIDVQIFCDSELRISSYTGLLTRTNAYTPFYLTSNSPCIYSVTDKYNNNSSYDAYRSFDNSTTTYWRHSAVAGHHNVILDFQSEKRVHGFYLDDINFSSTSGVGDSTKDILFTVSFSKDATTWTDFTVSLSGNTMSNGCYEYRLNDSCVDARYVAFTINNKTASSYVYFKNFYALFDKQA